MKTYLLLLFAVATTLCKAQNPILWGVTPTGGTTNQGTIFQFSTGNSDLKSDYSFSDKTLGQYPFGSLIKASSGLLYGLTSSGGTNDSGTIFSYDISLGKETDLWNFGNGTDGQQPLGGLLEVGDSALYGVTLYGGAYGEGIIFSYNISNGRERDLHDFGNGTDGANPQSVSLIQANNGLLYGTTSRGGLYGPGTIFSYNITDNTETDIHDFGVGNDGIAPMGSLFQATDSLLYGTTFTGGALNVGMLFSYDISNGKEVDLYDFGTTNSSFNPFGSLIQVSDSLLYGLTPAGGPGDNGGCGTLFSYNILSDTETLLYAFGNVVNGGVNPNGTLILASNGLLYGTAEFGGANDSGIIFSYNITADTVMTVHSFTGVDGQAPESNLIEDDDTATNVNQLSATNNHVSIYPNPSNGEINITSTKNIDEVQVTNLLGQLVYTGQPKQANFIFQLNNDGMYFVTVTSNNQTTTSKIIVSK